MNSADYPPLKATKRFNASGEGTPWPRPSYLTWSSLSRRCSASIGDFCVTVAIINPLDPSRRITFECFVDTGATYSIIPGLILEQLGIGSLRKDTFTVATGEQQT